MGRRSVSTDLVRNIELLVGVALPLFLTGVYLQDSFTGAGHWVHPLESGFFEWLSLIPILTFVGLLHSVVVAVVAALWPRRASRVTVVLGAVVMVPLLVLAGRPLELLVRYAVPLAVALVVYAMASRIPGRSEPPDEDERTAPLREDELLGHGEAPFGFPAFEPERPEPPVPPRPPSPGAPGERR